MIEFINTALDITEIVFVVFGVLLFFAGFKLIRISHLFMVAFFGFILGFLIGDVLNITLLSYIFGIGLALVFAYFCFVYHKYLKGVTLGVVAFLLFTYIGFLLFSSLIIPLIFATSITMFIVILNYIFECLVTVIFTSFLGSILLLEHFFMLDLWLFMLISVLGLIIGSILQLLILKKWPNYI